MEKLTKVCSKCKAEKVIDEFRKHERSRNGYKTQCKQCDYEYHRLYIENNRANYNEYMREYQKNINYKHTILYHKRNPDIGVKVCKKGVDNLSDRYVKSQIRHFPQELINNPEMIEIKRLIIQTKRLCRT